MKGVASLRGPIALVVAWALAGLWTQAVPTPWAVLTSIAHDGFALYSPNLSITAWGALQGFAFGNLAAIAVALAVAVFPRTEPLAAQLAVISYCIPLLALGPIVLVVFGGRTPTVFLAAVSVFFTSMIGTLTGLKSANRTSIELINAYGGKGWQRLIRVQIPAALPAMAAALQIAAPAAVLGAILGEYLGGVDSGIGVALTAAQSSYDLPRTWGMALAAGLLAGAGYFAASLSGKVVQSTLYGPGAISQGVES
ncbi:ABC transporter permease [Nocardia camponoti]|uniref:Nitrate ABC transporter permease n=1 Tax=Nocardia camponoti TaxID=1616106 RepID=A0A917V7D3_9NOCA|nr:ABC transporter permease subunit [Nocardia camponoti]GGK48601.1 nitrate ABC transporter permease [Nocardia camponoti]